MGDEQAVTHGTGSWADKMCKCAECGLVAECTPDFDFMVLLGDETRALYCPRCKRIVLERKMKERGMTGSPGVL